MALMGAPLVANLLVRRGSPGDVPTVGDCGRGGRAGKEALPEPSRIGGEIPVPPCEGRIQGGSEWPGSMALASQPQVTAKATIAGVGAIRRQPQVTAMTTITTRLQLRGHHT